MTETYSISLCSIGDCGSCLFSWCCYPCALAQARSNMDNSSCCFNFFCVSPVATRWMIRTAYGIPGDGCNDCMEATFCPCCSVNQLYQTTNTKKNPTSDGGRSFNTNPFESSLSNADCGAGCYACCCMPCFVGSTLERSVGMPCCMGCMCTNLCVARNMIRYHYRIHGGDIHDECLVPCIACLIGIHCVPCFLPAIIAYSVQLSAETDRKSTVSNRRYLTGYTRAAIISQPHQTMQVQGTHPHSTQSLPYSVGYNGAPGQIYMQQPAYAASPNPTSMICYNPGQVHPQQLFYSQQYTQQPQYYQQYPQQPTVVYSQATVIPDQHPPYATVHMDTLPNLHTDVQTSNKKM